MAKDYIQDILPPDDSNSRMHAAHASHSGGHTEETRIPIHTRPSANEDDTPPGERSIRNISVQRRSRPADSRESMAGVMVSSPRKGGGKWLLWTGAIASAAVLGILLLVALRSTVVDVTPRAQKITFETPAPFTAYPASASSGTLSYTIRTLDLEDSEVVASTGTVHAEEKATGTLVVYNDFQTSPYKLVRNTRFEAPGGLIFRTPAEVVIPGKKGTTPGQVTITVVADQAGAEYNVAPAKFTVPGLRGSASYAKIYAQSTQQFAGGFKGERPGVSESDRATALAAVRGRLEAKARASIDNTDESVIVLPDLVQISYTEDAPTQEAGGGVRLHEKAHVVIPAFPTAEFATTIGGASGIDATAISFVPGDDFTAQMLATTSAVGSGPLQFALSGSATMVWQVDTIALQQALAGKPQAGFQEVVKRFPGIEEARARVEPFWRNTFPTEPSAIRVTIGEPKAQ